MGFTRWARIVATAAAGATLVTAGVVTVAVATSATVTPDECVTQLAAPLIDELDLAGVTVGVDTTLGSGTMAEVRLLTPDVVRVAPGPATWCGGTYEPDLRAILAHELGHVLEYDLTGRNPVQAMRLRHQLEAAYGSEGDALEGAANCIAERLLGHNIARYVPGPEVCAAEMLTAADAIISGRWPS